MLTRHAPSRSTRAMTLAADHPAVAEARPLFTRSANAGKAATARVLVGGVSSRKLGRVVTKGKWRGFPIYTLTLEERATCPTSCALWRGCYGNRMPWAIRRPAGDETESRVEAELTLLQARHARGFVVRLHVLGDFYSVAYVERWRAWLAAFPALHVFGYTARDSQDPIGVAVRRLVASAGWARFAIRSSGGVLDLPAALVGDVAGVVCPVETGRTATCGTCALCWSAPSRAIVFKEH